MLVVFTSRVPKLYSEFLSSDTTFFVFIGILLRVVKNLGITTKCSRMDNRENKLWYTPNETLSGYKKRKNHAISCHLDGTTKYHPE